MLKYEKSSKFHGTQTIKSFTDQFSLDSTPSAGNKLKLKVMPYPELEYVFPVRSATKWLTCHILPLLKFEWFSSVVECTAVLEAGGNRVMNHCEVLFHQKR